MLPIFERLFLGGEYSIRGFDIRSIGPRDPVTGVVLGGNKSLLFNAEFITQIMGPVRLVLFYDTGQVRNHGQKFAFEEDIIEIVQPPPPVLIDPLAQRPGRSERADCRTRGRSGRRAPSRPRPAPRSASSCRC